MRVALALFRFVPHGGMQRDLLASAHALRARGHEVSIACHDWLGPRPDGLHVHVLPASGRSNHARARRFAQAFGEHRRALAPDVAVGFDRMPGLDWYFAADRSFVARTEGRRWPYRLTPRARTFTALERSVFAPTATTRVLLLSDATGSEYRRIWQTPAERFVLLPPGVARDRCCAADDQRANGRRELGVADDEPLLLMLATNPRLKGLDRAIDAFAKLPYPLRERAHLLAVGAPPDRRLQRRAEQLGIGARMRMLPPRDDVPRLLQAADVLLHPTRPETGGAVLLEALCAGLPAVCSDASGYAVHVARAGTGELLRAPDDPELVARAIVRQLERDRADVRARAARYRERQDLHGLHERLADAVTGVAVTAP